MILKNHNASSQDQWNTYYKTNESLFDKYLPQFFIVDTIRSLFNDDLSGKRILETGCGRGLDSIALAQSGAESTVVDFSENALELLRKKCRDENIAVSISTGDLRTVEFEDNFFDCIFHSGVLEHFSDKEQKDIIKKQGKWLKHGGYLFVEVPQRYNIYTLYKKLMMKLDRWPPGWETEFSKKQLTGLIEECGLSIEHVLGRDLFTLAFLRKLSKKLGFRERPPGWLSRHLGNIFQENRLCTNLFLNISVIAKKE